jgi:ABC-type phosphate transport system substrate-binding protein
MNPRHLFRKTSRMSQRMMKTLPVTCLAAMAMAMPAWGAEIVIVNSATTDTGIPKDVLKAIYNGRKRSLPSGTRVEVLDLDGPVHDQFVSNVLDSSPAQYTTYWQKLVFTGQGKLPRVFASEHDMVAYVAATPGAIGYIESATPHDGVKVLTISE